ncbi:IS3 family transposase [Pseudophaeobacter sp. C1-32P7]|uniref:IS3 family transposase n=1 Tax=Pseudophaeobacter sp. C1-32P7 TaxID=3098142 RepID=UPI0034D70C88
MDLKLEIECVREQNYKVYGVRKVWHQLRRDGFDVARCTVAWRHCQVDHGVPSG